MGKDKLSNMPAEATASELDEFRTLIEQRSAILFDASRERFFSPRVNQYVREIGEPDAAGLLRRIRGSNVEYDRFLESLLTQETSFFRYPAIFQALERVVLPEVQARKMWSNPRVLRIWSAGCSTGEEPYSIAITVADTLQPRITPSREARHLYEPQHRECLTGSVASRLHQTWR